MDDKNSVLLSSGYRMPLVGLGTWQTDDEDSAKTALVKAIEAGYRHIDTAFAYKNEEFLGRTLKGIFQEGKVKREDLFITTKLPSNGMRPQNASYFLNKSLKDLQLDYVDLYLVHSPLACERTEDDYGTFGPKDKMDNEIDLVETWKAMEKFVDAGLVRSIGLSNFNSQQIQRVYDAARIKPTNLQVECHAYLPQNELQDFCKNLGISFTAYSPIGSPGLPEFVRKRFRVDYPDNERLLDDPRLKPISEKHGKTPSQILLRYLVQRGIMVIPKSSNPKRIQENLQVFDFALSEDEMATLKSMGKNHRYFKFDHMPMLKNHPEFPFSLPF